MGSEDATRDTEPPVDKGREIAASIFDGAAVAAAALASLVPGVAGTGLGVAGALAKAVASLIRSVGTDNTKALIDELQRRKDEGKITDANVARDNQEIADAVSEMYKQSAKE